MGYIGELSILYNPCTMFLFLLVQKSDCFKKIWWYNACTMCFSTLVQKCNNSRQIFSENFSSLWGLNGRGSSLSFLSELYALPGKACLPCLIPESDKVLVNLANSCRGAWLCLMRVWGNLVQDSILCTMLVQYCIQDSILYKLVLSLY